MPQLTAAVRGRSRCCPAHPDQSPPWRTHHFRLPLPRLPPRHLPPLHHHLFFRQRQPTQSLPLSPRRLSVPLPRMRAPCLWRRRRYGAPRRAAVGPRYQPGSGAAGSMPTLWQSTTTRVNRWLASSSVSTRTTTDSRPAWHMQMGPPTSEGTSRTSMELREKPCCASLPAWVGSPTFRRRADRHPDVFRCRRGTLPADPSDPTTIQREAAGYGPLHPVPREHR